MRSIFGFLTTFAACAIGATTPDVSVLAFGSEAQQRQDLEPAVVSSTTIHQLLELQFTPSSTSTLEGSDENTIELLERLSDLPNTLFGASDVNGELDRILIILEGLGDQIDSSILNEYRSELIASTFATDSARDIERYIKARPESTHCILKSFMKCLPDPIKSDRAVFDQARTGESWSNDLEGMAIVHVVFEGTKPSLLSESSLRSLLSDLRSFSVDGKRATVVLSKSATIQKFRLAPEVENVGPALHFARDDKAMTAKQQAQAPLSLLPVCHSSNTSCNDATDTCSGHGVCYKKSSDCYACRCSETGWGGSACHKKDVSSPFFLILGISVGIVVVIGAAVGMLFRVGDTELPGVISAGVGATGAQK